MKDRKNRKEKTLRENSLTEEAGQYESESDCDCEKDDRQ